jgi:hypothetical protein
MKNLKLIGAFGVVTVSVLAWLYFVLSSIVDMFKHNYKSGFEFLGFILWIGLLMYSVRIIIERKCR